MRNKRLLIVGTIILALGAGFAGGFYFFKHQNDQEVDAIIQNVINKDTGKDSAIDFSLFWQVWDKLHERYVDGAGLDSQKLVYGAIAGMVGAVGDPYTTFFEPEISKEFQEQVTGAFSGVGMEIGKRDGVIIVISPIKDSPAIRAGIKAQDVVVKVDGKSTADMSVEEAVTLIRGKKGTTVELTLMRQGEEKPLVFTVARDTIKIPAIDWKLIDAKIAYLQIYSFNGNLDKEFEQAAQEILTSNADRLIVDLRGNPGGLLDSAVYLGGWFLEPNTVVVQEKDGEGTKSELRAMGNAKLLKYPTVVLMDGGSASAAEILAGALHDIRNIPLIGEKSFGKGSVQTVENFYNGSSLKVTIAKWFTPNGISISDTGISPTVSSSISAEDIKAYKIEAGNPDKDPQLKKALEIIREMR